jgi:hypothetical protein
MINSPLSPVKRFGVLVGHQPSVFIGEIRGQPGWLGFGCISSGLDDLQAK